MGDWRTVANTRRCLNTEADSMKTALDDGGTTWLLESLSYEHDLRATVVELFKHASATSLKVADHAIDGLHALNPSASSRRFTISFSRAVAWQLVDESYTAFDTTEERDDMGFIQILTRSPYLAYIQTNHGWFVDVAGAARHYRLWTENEVIDVIAHEPPVLARC
jgi:hypothetical protein